MTTESPELDSTTQPPPPKRTPANRAADRTYNAKRVVVSVSFNPEKPDDAARLAKLAIITKGGSVTAWFKDLLDSQACKPVNRRTTAAK